MTWFTRTINSSIGAKMIMAVTGLGLFLFLVGHLTGNLISYAGQDAFNTYAANMQSLGALLWVARLGLLVVLLTHIYFAVRLTAMNKAARPIGYACKNTVVASYASRTMMRSGLIVFFFICFHLAHYTLFLVDPSFAHMHDEFGRHDAYRMLVVGFSSPVVSGFYILGMLVLGLHLSHGLSSLFQSLGLNHSNFTPFINKAGPVIAWAIVAGFISIPISVLCGVITLAGGAG